MPLTAFVTGATGFLGLNLVRHLSEAGWRVTALHRPASDLTYLSRFPVTLAVGAIEDPDSLRAAMPQNLDAVFHVAGDVSFWATHNARQRRVNVDGTRHVLEAARHAGARRFVHTSSLAVYGLPPGPINEAAPHRGRGSWIGYLDSKAQAEEEVQKAVAAGLDAVILNPANIVGPYDLVNWSRLFRLVHDGRLPGVPPGRAPFCHVADVALAHLAAWERGRMGENYILGGPDASYLEVFAVAGGLLGRPTPTKSLPAFALALAGRASAFRARLTGKEPDMTPEMAALLSATLQASSDKAARELGYGTTSLEAMFRDCYDWLTAEGLL